MQSSLYVLLSLVIFISGFEIIWAVKPTFKKPTVKTASLKTDYDYNDLDVPTRKVSDTWKISGAPPIKSPRQMPPVAPQYGPQQAPVKLLEPGVDYCNTPCKDNHIACQRKKLQPSPDCPMKPQYNDMRDLKEFIVAFHNHLRNTVASGLMPNFKPAVRMATMSWSNTLHAMAALKTNLCESFTNVCHGTKEFPYSGQNAATYSYMGSLDVTPISMVVKDILDHWYNGSTRCTRDIIKSFEPPQKDTSHLPDYGVFTMMVRDDNTHVGCALNRYEPMHNYVKVVFSCAYATNNILKKPTYKEGPPASKCETGKNSRYPNLCSTREDYSSERLTNFKMPTNL